MNTPFPTLLSPLRIGRHVLKNRVIMGSMHTRLEQLDRAQQREIAFYAARAKGGAAMIVTAGYSPNEEGRLEEHSHILDAESQIPAHREITQAVHAHGAKMLLQILHAGRYAKHDRIVGPSALRSPINRRTPREMTEADIERTIADFAACAALAARAGYDGVEVMGSEGYLLTQFATSRANRRTDEWGGDSHGRARFAVEVVRRIRAVTGPEFLLMYRLSALDLVEGGLMASEIDHLARAVERAGADVLSTGIGWHEAPVPTIAYQVPRAAYRFASARLRSVVSIPVVATNRINTPEVAEQVIASGAADLVALARPMLADPDFVAKAAAGRADEINTCIACNQACLDYIFSDRVATCLVNPRAAREIEFEAPPPARTKRIAVIGSGPAGLSFAFNAAERGHHVVLFESESELGGQLNLATRIPGKTEFFETLRYFRVRLARLGVEQRLGCTATFEMLRAERFEHIVVATGVLPRTPEIAGIGHPKVVSYLDLLRGSREAGDRVAIIGTGGIGHDVAEFLIGREESATTVETFLSEWGVEPTIASPGGLAAPGGHAARQRQITLFQRSHSRVGERLGVSTGWILRSRLRRHGVNSVAGCTYHHIDDAGLHYSVGGKAQVAEVDTIVLCAGQEAATALFQQLQSLDTPVDLIGGARSAAELDALRAIDEGARLALQL